MAERLFDEQDLAEIRARGIGPEQVSAQIERFRKGFPFANLDRPCTIGDGITVLDEGARVRLGGVYEEAALAGRVMKFVPASGAASRMFKSLLAVLDRMVENGTGLSDLREDDPDGKATARFFREIRNLAFHDPLKRAMHGDGLDLDAEIRGGRYRTVLEYALTPRGLNLASLPKGLIPFHAYPGRSRTAFEEHLAEAPLYAMDRDGRVRIHFTISAEHREAVVPCIREVQPFYERSPARFEIAYSVQEPSTDTVAVDGENRPFRDERGRLLFRPGGHGALLENLENLRGDIVFIKNIDNVAPDRLKGPTVEYKKALGGLLVELQGKIFSYLGRLNGSPEDPGLLREAMEFMRGSLAVTFPTRLADSTPSERRELLLHRLSRPLRVCGMVRNAGEPGGGPHWVRSGDGTLSLQIVESSQVDMRSDAQRAIWQASTHFNPVDLVCGLRDFRGRPFRLQGYRDPDTGFISVKSWEGRDLKALELPGLWNGAMAFWNTVFVEVPSATFSPVKTVLDLLRPEHQPVG